MTDFRALCIELTDCLEKADWPLRYRYVFRQWVDIARAALADEPAVPDGREPASVTGQPSDEELLELWQGWNLGWDPQKGMVLMPHPAEYARAVLARWGHQPAPPADGEVAELVAWLRERATWCTAEDPAHKKYDRAAELLQRQALVPVSVSERLPGPEDCDAEGRCWLLTVEDEYPQWRLHSIQGAQSGGAMIWVPVDSSPGVLVDCFYTSHWLPATALPVPQGEVE